MALGKGESLMWTYNKVLQYPIRIKCPNPKLAKCIISQYGGPDGELAASLRYLSQRFAMPDQNAKAILNDIGTEELAPKRGRLSIKLTNNLLKRPAFGTHFLLLKVVV